MKLNCSCASVHIFFVLNTDIISIRGFPKDAEVAPPPNPLLTLKKFVVVLEKVARASYLNYSRFVKIWKSAKTQGLCICSKEEIFTLSLASTIGKN